MRRGITFEDVGFSYESTEVPVLENVSFSIPRGKTTALVGSSGAGKSTIADLVIRLDDPRSGRIMVDDNELSELEIESWRGAIGVVSQDAFIFNASVRDNIAYGKLGATEDEIVQAAKRANAHGFVTEMENGYETLLGDRGVRLSGGQCQRIAIARAVLREPQILVLDEATSSLDTESERLVQEAIDRLAADRTVLVIAHRLSTVEHADQLVVLEEGRIVETGTHEELLRKNGRYAELYRLQYRKALSEESSPES